MPTTNAADPENWVDSPWMRLNSDNDLSTSDEDQFPPFQSSKNTNEDGFDFDQMPSTLDLPEPALSQNPSSPAFDFAAAVYSVDLVNQLLQDTITSSNQFDVPDDDAAAFSDPNDVPSSEFGNNDINIDQNDSSNAAPASESAALDDQTASKKKTPPSIKITAPDATVAAPVIAVSTAPPSSSQQSFSRVPDFIFDPTRTWTTVFKDPTFLGPDGDVEVRAKTRCDEPCLSVPDRLYSSMKYEIIQRAVGQFVTSVPFLLSRITVVNSETSLEVRPNNRPAVKGSIEAALVKPTDKKKRQQQQQQQKQKQKQKQKPIPSPNPGVPILEGQLRAQFQDISFHSDHTLYCWQINYFAPADLEHPVLTKRSPSFKVFARKPGKPIPTRKRKRGTANSEPEDPQANNNTTTEEYDSNEQDSDATTSNSKKPKPNTPQEAASASSSSSAAPDANPLLDEFRRKLDEVVRCRDRMTQSDKQSCLELVKSKLLAVDRSLSSLFPSSPSDSTDVLHFLNQQHPSSPSSSPDLTHSSFSLLQ